MKAYDRLNNFLQGKRGGLTENQKKIPFAVANFNDCYEFTDKTMNMPEGFHKKAELLENIQKSTEITVKDFKFFKYNKYFILGNYNLNREKDKIIIDRSLKHFEDIIMFTYLGIFDTITINDEDYTNISKDYFEDIIIDEQKDEDVVPHTIEFINKISELNIVNNNKFHFIVNNKGNKIIITGVYDREKQSGQFILTFVNNVAQIIETGAIVIEKDDIYTGIESIYAKKDHIAKKFIEKILNLASELHLTQKESPGLFMVRLLYIFRHICQKVIKSKMSYEVTQSSPIELSLIHTIIANKDYNPDSYKNNLVIKIPVVIENKMTSEINELPPEDIKKIMESYDPEFKEKYLNAEGIEKILDEIIFNKEKFTEVELDSEECHKIVKYVGKKYSNGKNYCNLLEIFKNQRYGQNIKMNLFEDSDDFIYVYPIINDETKNLFLNFYFENKKYKIMFTALFTNADKFQFGCHDNLKHLEMFISIGPEANLIPSRYELIKILPDGLEKASRIIVILSLFLSIYTMIYDRPEKLCTCRKEYKGTKVSNPKKYSKSESDLIIKHIVAYRPSILKRIKEAKISGIHRQVEYVVENWDRVGHLRTYKSGKSVWIDPVQCHRHKELTSKTVKVKY